MTKIKYDGRGQLYITNITEAISKVNASDSEYDAVVTVCQDSIEDHVSDNIEYTHKSMADSINPDVEGSHQYPKFAVSANELHNHLKNRKSVLIHCHAGQSRSVSVSVAALGRLLNKPRDEALNIIHRDRKTFQNPSKFLIDHADKYIKENTGIEPPFSKYE
jgi:protein-tyrosine phosphatase